MKRTRSALGRIVMGVLGAALVVGLVVVGGEETLRSIADAELVPILGALVASALLYPVASWRWGAITDALAGRVVASPWDYLRVRVLSGASGFIMPREIAEIGGRTLWLNRARGLSVAQAAQAVLIDRVCDLFVSLVSLLPALLYLFSLVTAPMALAMMVAVVLAACVLFPQGMRLVLAIAARPLAFIQSGLARLPYIGRHVTALPSPDVLPDAVWRRAMLLSAAKFALVALRVALLAAAVGVTLSEVLMMVLVPLGQLAYLIAVTPGGLGIYEAGWFGILHAHGVDTGIASAFVLVLRASLIASIAIMVPLVLLPIGGRLKAAPSPSRAEQPR